MGIESGKVKSLIEADRCEHHIRSHVLIKDSLLHDGELLQPHHARLLDRLLY